MREELDKKLTKTFPYLYADRYTDMRSTAMCWGFECGEGWFKIIWNLSKDLEAEIKKQPKEKREWYKASQVKEKFGGLRFYMNSSTEKMEKLIDKAERKSYKTCETCGKPGKRNDGGWIVTLCDRCEEKK